MVSNASDTSRKTRKGRVVSTDMDKTIIVEIQRIQQHDLYKKYLRRHSRFKVHDEQEQANEGDIVNIRETRPVSKSKRWNLDTIIEAQDVQAIELEDDEDQDEQPEPVTETEANASDNELSEQEDENQ